MAPTYCKDCSIKISGFFKKKFTCHFCSNRFCDKCFSKVNENAMELSKNIKEMAGRNCLSCVVLQCSKITREHLFLLENKQLATYLNGKQISTVSCSEKYHLVDLIMDFAESHGIKSGDDIETEVMHRDHVEDLRKKAEMLRIQEQNLAEETNRNNENTNNESEEGLSSSSTHPTSETFTVDNETEQPEFSGGTGNNDNGTTDDLHPQSINNDTITSSSSENENEPNSPSNNQENVENEIGMNVEVEDENHDAENNEENQAAAAAGESESSNQSDLSPRHQASGKWRSVEDIQVEEDIRSLSVLELKQILTANFINYRGCCEKKELIDKVTMLYQSQQVKANLDDKDDRDLCKICMNHMIDCIFLDCAHLVACTKCGKKLSECPICRALIVRVVHIFRA